MYPAFRGIYPPLGNLGPLVPQLHLRIPQNFHLGLRPNALLDVRIEHVYPTLLYLLSDPTWKSLGNFGPLVVPREDRHGDDVVLFLAPSTLDEAGLECLRIIDSHRTCEKIKVARERENSNANLPSSIDSCTGPPSASLGKFARRCADNYYPRTGPPPHLGPDPCNHSTSPTSWAAAAGPQRCPSGQSRRAAPTLS